MANPVRWELSRIETRFESVPLGHHRTGPPVDGGMARGRTVRRPSARLWIRWSASSPADVPRAYGDEIDHAGS